jgi:glycosyltransferase involved in cell wall biosynthesis
MAPATVAVIIPTYNRAALLPAALDSVIAQTTPECIEVVVIDDGSTDETHAVIEPYLERFGSPTGKILIRYVRLEKQGVVTARNTGIDQTGAPYVAFLDSDDYWEPGKLKAQLDVIQEGSGVGVVHTSFRYVDDQGRFCDDGANRLDNPCVGWCVDALLDEDLVIFSSVLMSRDVINRAAEAEPHGKPFDPRWTNAQDYDLLLRAARLEPFAYVPQPLTLYRLHGAHGAMGNLKKAYGFHCRVQFDFVSRYGDEIGIDKAEARRRAAAFLLGRVQAAFWRRQMDIARGLCELARELEVDDRRFDDWEKRSSRPIWVYTIKDTFDRLLGRG